MNNPLTLPSSFRQTALAFPNRVKAALKTLDDPYQAADLLDKAEGLSHYARHIRAETEVINSIQYGKLLLIAKLAEWLKPLSAKEYGAKGGRGKKGAISTIGPFSPNTLSLYRKIGDHAVRIDEYYVKIEEHNRALPREHPDILEVSTNRFLRFIGSNGDIKANQNKGVIEWYTPAEYIEAARKAMGSIDLDPASTRQANETIKAKRFYTKQDDGLKKSWAGNIWLNPPFRADLIALFITKLCDEYRAGNVKQAVLLTNNNTDTCWWHRAAANCEAVCFTKGRIAFYNPAGETAAPTNGHTLFYFGKKLAAFIKNFSAFGTIMRLVSKEKLDG